MIQTAARDCLHRVLPPASALLVSVWIAAAPAAEQPSPDSVRLFESRVRPILFAHCYKCHATEKQRGGLRLDSRQAMLTGGDHGPAFVPGQPDKSLLVQAVRQDG